MVANALVKVEGNRKSVQHLEGGIVKEMRVKEGDRVAAGDVLIVLDDGQARAEYEVLTRDFIVLRATEERLRAELAHRSQMTLPDDLKAYAEDPYLKDVSGCANPSNGGAPCSPRRTAPSHQGENGSARASNCRLRRAGRRLYEAGHVRQG